MEVHPTSRPIWKSAAARRLLFLAGKEFDARGATHEQVEDAIELVVKKVLSDVKSPPIQLDALKERLNVIEFASEERLPFSGELRRVAGGFKIVYASYLSPSRRRFTIAHELGHVLFEGTGSKAPQFGRELERLCDMIASEILMPRCIFLQHAKGPVSLKYILRLSKLFEASVAATAIRYARLLKLSVFEVNADRVMWGVGAVQGGPFTALFENLREEVQRILQEGSGEAVLRHYGNNWTGSWKLEGQKLGDDGRTLFLLFPERIGRPGAQPLAATC